MAIAGCSGGPTTSVDQAPDASKPSVATPLPTATPEIDATSAPTPVGSAGLSVRLEAFEDGGTIPDRFTCIGANDSPSISWSGVPAAARSLALIVYDPDAGAELGAGNDLGFLHWMVYDISPTAGGLPLGATGNVALLAGGVETANDFSGSAGGKFPGGAPIRGTGYDGPCPPALHTYVFRLLALDERLGLPAGTPYQSVMSAWQGRVLAVADWTGIYPGPK
jgi:Raf kinase inhibitor-like YbhB/YbcL family protein